MRMRGSSRFQRCSTYFCVSSCAIGRLDGGGASPKLESHLLAAAALPRVSSPTTSSLVKAALASAGPCAGLVS